MFCNADDGNIVRNLNPSSKDEASISMYYEKIENYSGSTFKITFELSEGMDYLYIEPLFVFQSNIFFSQKITIMEMTSQSVSRSYSFSFCLLLTHP